MPDPLELFFDPEGVAIIGASANPLKLSHGVVRNLKNCGYRSPIYPVNPKGDEILGLQVYPSVLEVPDPVELAVIIVPAPYVAATLEECGQRGIKAVIVITGGFREAGSGGAAKELQLKGIADRYGMRLIGPNCVGVMDTHLPLDTTFISAMPRPGHIGFVSHSGAICGGTADWARGVSVGCSRIASLGNQLDVDIADGIRMMQSDPNTRVISIYAEGLPDGRRFIDAALSVFRDKPIVMLKAGLTSSGTRAVASHTGALAGDHQAYIAACHRAGVLVVDSLQEQNDLAIALATQPLPQGNRVAVLTNAGGPAALAADELDRGGLVMANLDAETIELLRTVTQRGAQLTNPVDMLGGPRSEMYREAGRILLEDPNVDMLMAIFVPQTITPIDEVVANVVAAAETSSADASSADAKPVVCCLVGGESIADAARFLNMNSVPFYQDPNRAARALCGLRRYARIRARPDLTPQPVEDVDRASAHAILTAAWRKTGAGLLDAETSAAVVVAYGITVPRSGLASTAGEAVGRAEILGYPLAMKLIDAAVVHKADVGGVVLNLLDAAAVRRSFETMVGAPRNGGPGRADVRRVMLQRMASSGQEVILGARHDAQFGPVLMFGMGGIFVEALDDVAFRLAPLNAYDAEQMVMETAAGQIMRGVRGQPPRDISKVVDTVRRIGQLVHDFPCIGELDINPLIVQAAASDTATAGVSAVDVRIAIAEPPT